MEAHFDAVPPAPPALPEPPVPAGSRPPSQSPMFEHRFVFDGRANEYFRIWIVNLALTLLSLGIFSAWAKVRSERYFYGSTRLAGVPFEYTAKPLPILKAASSRWACFRLTSWPGNTVCTCNWAWLC
ncbi:MAG: DUF898 family protein [Xanthomonadales bacterium]|nr:DUF898 family protein [Xanthomonadales bacterium]